MEDQSEPMPSSDTRSFMLLVGSVIAWAGAGSGIGSTVVDWSWGSGGGVSLSCNGAGCGLSEQGDVSRDTLSDSSSLKVLPFPPQLFGPAGQRERNIIWNSIK